VGLVVTPNSSESLERAIQNYRKHPVLAEQQGRAGRYLSDGKYAAGVMLDKYFQIIRLFDSMKGSQIVLKHK